MHITRDTEEKGGAVLLWVEKPEYSDGLYHGGECLNIGGSMGIELAEGECKCVGLYEIVNGLKTSADIGPTLRNRDLARDTFKNAVKMAHAQLEIAVGVMGDADAEDAILRETLAAEAEAEVAEAFDEADAAYEAEAAGATR